VTKTIDGSSHALYLLRAEGRANAKRREHPETHCTCGESAHATKMIKQHGSTSRMVTVSVDHSVRCALTIDRRRIFANSYRQGVGSDILLQLKRNAARRGFFR
jgi:hypothetical protein